MSEGTWPVHSPPRITDLTFANALSEGPKFSKASVEVGPIWDLLLTHGVDPSFALGQFWVESLFGTAGWNVWADPPLRSWGNILYENTLLRKRPGVFKYAAANGYNYTGYPDWATGVEDYCLLLNQYRETSPDPRYGDTSLIKGATAKWHAKAPHTDSAKNYLEIVLARMDRYDIRPDFEGDMFTWTPDIAFQSNYRYAMKKGEYWYVKAGGSEGYPLSADGKAVFLGRVHGSSGWGAVKIVTGRFSPDGKPQQVIGYVNNFDPARVSKA